MSVRLVLLACAAVALSACEPAGSTEPTGFALDYYKDSRTGLCFAERMSYTDQAVLTNVPCTVAVEAEIKRRAKK